MVVNLSEITLRPFNLTDADDLMTYAGDDQATRNLRCKTLTAKDKALTFIKDVCIPHPWRRSICFVDRSIGFISVFPGSGDERCKADIGHGVAPKYWGQGVATKAVKMALPQGFKDLPEVVRHQAFVSVKNKASQKGSRESWLSKGRPSQEMLPYQGNTEIYLFIVFSPQIFLLIKTSWMISRESLMSRF